jgi:hypothetical protein
MLNTMNFVWAFNFDHAINPETKEHIPVDLWAYHKVMFIFSRLDAYMPNNIRLTV